MDKTIAARPPRATENKARSMPHIYVILMACVVLATLATHLVPAGSYDRIPGPGGRSIVDPATYHEVAPNPAGLTQLIMAVPHGLASVADIIFFVLMVGGLFAVLRRAGVVELAVDRLARRFARHPGWLVPLLMIVFSGVASAIGTPELSMVYVPVILPLLIALGHDSLTAAAVALCSTCAGFAAGILNPFTTAVAQKVADLPLYSGWSMRLAVFASLSAASIAYVARYANRVRRDRSNSLLCDEESETAKWSKYQEATLHATASAMTGRQRLAATGVITSFGVLLYGVTQAGWYLRELSGLFLVTGVLVGMAAGLGGNAISDAFTEGFRDVLVGAMVVGLARGVGVVLDSANVLDTIVHHLAIVVGQLPSWLTAIGMLASQLAINFAIPSGSAQALLTMPVMAPLGDIVGVTRQTAVLAFQLGDGLSNIVYPTAGYFMATLGIAGVSWLRWIRFFLPLFAIWIGISMAFLVYAQAVQWTG